MKTLYGKLLFVLCLFFLITCIHVKEKQIILPLQKNKQEEYIVTVLMNEKTLSIPLEEYLVGVIAGEMPISFELEALKAQAVASRTFVLSRSLKVDNTTASQVYLTDEEMKQKWGDNYLGNKEKIERAIEETKGKVMTYQGEYISALFFSSSNGSTVNCEDYFQGEVAYLKAVDSHWDLTIDPHNQKSQTKTGKMN